MAKAASKDNDHKEIYLATENTEILLILIDTVFARLAFFGKTFFPKRASSKGRCLVRECLRPSLLSQAKDTDLIGRAFKNNDQLKTNPRPLNGSGED